jgi:hypothetical protein
MSTTNNELTNTNTVLIVIWSSVDNAIYAVEVHVIGKNRGEEFILKPLPETLSVN